jgi:hypothetical protein
MPRDWRNSLQQWLVKFEAAYCRVPPMFQVNTTAPLIAATRFRRLGANNVISVAWQSAALARESY